MRLSELILVVFILVWACVGSNNAVARKHGIVRNLFDGAKKNNSTSGGAHNLKTKKNKRDQQLGHRFSCSDNNNTTAVSDDKRVVPTGPNPLHNR